MDNTARNRRLARMGIILGVITVILVIVTAVAVRTTSRMIRDRAWAARSQQLLAELQEARALIDDAEDHQRGYLLTNDESFLDSVEESIARFQSKLKTLASLTQDNVGQHKRLERLASASEKKFASMRAAVEANRKLGPRESHYRIASEISRERNGGEADLLLGELVDVERGQSRSRLEQAEASDRWAMLMFALLLLSFLMSLIAFFWTVWRSLEKQSQAAEQLRKSREQYELAVRGSNDGLWDWDLESGRVFFSARWKSQLGYKDNEIQPHVSEFDSRLHPLDRDRVMKTVQLYLDEMIPIYSVEFRLRCKDGSYRWILARGVALRDAKGKPYRMAGSHTDTTERKEFESKLAEQNVLLEQAMRTERETNEALKRAQAMMVQNEKMAGLGQMVAGVAHEINNPLAFITNNVAVLQRDFDEMLQLVKLHEAAAPAVQQAAPEMARQIEAFRESTELEETISTLPSLLGRTSDGLKRIRRIVGDLRLFARLDEGDVNEADLNVGIESTLTIIQGHARSKDVELVRELSPLPKIVCNAARINQVVMNLISNAIDACNPGGKVTIRSEAEPCAVLIEVIDTGHGMSSTLLEKIFDPFFTTKPIGRGTGLGLSISYGIIRDHGGSIDVVSKPGQGSRFSVRLPLDPPSKIRDLAG